MNTSEVLDLAADKIQAEGWEQRGTKNSGVPKVAEAHSGGYCLEGALSAALGEPAYRMDFDDRGVPCPAYEAVAEYLDSTPWVWNDNEARSAEDVIAVLRAAAAVERAKEESLEGSLTTTVTNDYTWGM